MIRELNLSAPETLKHWEKIYKSSPFSTYFHSPSWAFLICDCFPAIQLQTRILNDGNNDYVYIEYYKKNISKLIYRESGVPTVYGGLLPANNISLSEEIIGYLRALNNRYIIMSPYLKYENEALLNKSLETSILKLNKHDDPILNFRKGHKADVKRAQRTGVEVELVRFNEDIKSYYDLYCLSLKRWGKKASGFYPKEIFHNLFNHRDYGSYITCYLAKWQGKPVAGAWYLFKDEKLNYWHGVYDADYAKYSPVHGLLYQAMDYYRKHGVQYFDMGPSGGFDALISFKKGFGAQSCNVPYLKNLNLVGRGYRYLNGWFEKKLRRSQYEFWFL